MQSVDKLVYALCHIDTDRLLCAQKDDVDYIICFSAQPAAAEFLDALGAIEHCEIVGEALDCFPIDRFYLDEEFTGVG